MNSAELPCTSPLFAGISPDGLIQMLSCLDARRKCFVSGEVVLLAGETADRIGVLLSGRAQVLREDVAGTRTIVAELMPGDLFAETFACASGGGMALPVTVQAAAESAVLLLDYRRMISSCRQSCPCHAKLIENMLAVLADKNLLLSRRLGHLSRRTTREKLLSYLSEQATLAGSDRFTIPFNRQELADYLCVERSAMSAALGRLREEGLLDFSRSRFYLRRDRWTEPG